MRGQIQKFDLAPSGDYDFYLGGENYEIGCFSWYDDELRDGIAAAAICSLTGLRSLDNARRKIEGVRSLTIDHDAPVKKMIRILDDHMISVYRSMRPRAGAHISQITFDQAMVRSFQTLKNTSYMARRGYLFETAMLARGLLEQIVWARAANSVKNEDELFEIDLHKQVTFAKKIYPTIGRVYGSLSRFAHFDASHHHYFYAHLDGEIATRFADRETKRIAMHWPLLLADIWVVVFEEAYVSRINKTLALTKKGFFKRSRLTKRTFENYFEGEASPEILMLFP